MIQSHPHPQSRNHRLKLVQDWLIAQGYDALIVPLTDPFQSEYVADVYNRLYHLTDFKGSAGSALITQDKGLLFVDSRYTLQAQQQSGDVYRIVNTAQETMGDYLKVTITAGGKVAVDALLTTQSQATQLRRHLAEVGGNLEYVDQNPIDALMGPFGEIPATPLFEHSVVYSGASSETKRDQLFEATEADHVVLADPVSVAWLMNWRAHDVPCVPVFLSYAIAHRSGGVDVYMHAPQQRLGAVSVSSEDQVRGTENFATDLMRLAQAKASVSVDAGQLGAAWYNLIEGAQIVAEKNPCLLLKSSKNEVEIAGMREAHLVDAVALCTFLHWIQTCDAEGKLPTELEAAHKLDNLRKAGSLFVEPSFDTISGSGPNGAVVHYRVTPETSRQLHMADIYVVDSGGQYLNGTTDVTRVVLLGDAPTHPEAPEFYTRVLKGHVGIASLTFPHGLCGSHMDVLARQWLWAVGCDYGHGTGHGVGHFLSVHESPPTLSLRASSQAFEVGMIVSNEPGYYKEGAFGIRIENLQVVQPSSFEGYLMFEPLTYVPLERRLILKDHLTAQEIGWIDAYHQAVLGKLAPRLTDKPAVLLWLEQACQPL